jgi:hypothetical protein
MCKRGLYLGLVCLPWVLLGCSSSREEASAPPSGASVTNSSPEARNAPGASGPGADVPRLGSMKRGNSSVPKP